MTDKTIRRLDELEIHESSGVDFPANKSSGWIVLKAAAITKPRIKASLGTRAKKLGLAIRDEGLEALTDKVFDTLMTNGTDFNVEEWDDDLVKVGAKPKPGEKPGGLPPRPAPKINIKTPEVEKADVAEKIVAALRTRAAQLGYAVSDADLKRIATEVFAPAQAKEPFSPRDWDDELRAAGKQLPTHPEPKTVPIVSKAEALVAQQKAAAREMLVERQVLAVATELENQGWDKKAAVAKAQLEHAGLTTTGIITTIAKSLEQAGMTPGQARLEAARAVLKVKQGHLRARGSATVEPTVKKLEVAEMLRVARVRKGLTQADLASEVGVSAPTVSKWECAEFLPEGINRFRVAKVLDLDMAAVKTMLAAEAT